MTATGKGRMGEQSVALYIAIISALSALAMGILNIFSIRRKTSAETNAITSDEWYKLYQEMKSRCEIFDGRLTGVEAENRKLKNKQAQMERQLILAEDSVEYLLGGINILVGQLKDRGIEPDWKPIMRGDILDYDLIKKEHK